MKRPGMRPTLDGMLNTPNASPSSSMNANSMVAGAQPAVTSSVTGSRALGVVVTGPGGRVLPRLKAFGELELTRRCAAATVGH